MSEIGVEPSVPEAIKADGSAFRRMVRCLKPRLAQSIRWRSAWPLFYVAIVSGSLFALFHDWSYDDPFITYRYADNLRLGLGFVYNPGERVLSTTSPLFTILLAALGYLSQDIPRLANLIGVFGLAVGALAIHSLGEEWGSRDIGWAGLVLYPTFPLLVSTLGSETPLYLALCLGSLAFYARRRYSAAALCAGLALLTRPDSLLLAILLGVDYLLHRPKRVQWSAVLIFSFLTLVWFSFAWVYFGSPLPATLAAKQHQGAISSSVPFTTGLLTMINGYAGKSGYWLEGALASLGLVIAVWRNRIWILFLLWPVAHYIAYSLLGVSRYFWYYAPLVPGLVVATGIGISSLHKWRMDFPTDSRLDLVRRGPLISNLVGTLPVPILTISLLCLLFLVQGADLLELAQVPDDRTMVYRSIGEWLEANTPSKSTIGSLDAGIIGYYSHRRVVDFAGLIQPDVSNQLTAQTNYDDSALWAAEHYHPDYIVLQEDTLPRFEETYIWYHCWPAQFFPGKEYHYSADISVFVCP